MSTRRDPGSPGSLRRLQGCALSPRSWPKERVRHARDAANDVIPEVSVVLRGRFVKDDSTMAAIVF